MDISFINEITISDIISWILAFFGGYIAYRIVDHMQTSIERHNVISDIENQLNIIFSSKIAKIKEPNEELESVMVRTVLHDFEHWLDYDKSIGTLIVDHQRYVMIRDSDNRKEYISTQALHEMLVLFRRIEKLFKDGIIKKIDLADLWREILPFAVSNRIGFLITYYTPRDIDSLIYVVFQTYLACEIHQIDSAVKYFRDNYEVDKNDFESLLNDNKRLRLIDKLKIKKFMSSLPDKDFTQIEIFDFETNVT